MFIKLTQELVTEVDFEDYLFLNNWIWTASADPNKNKKVYAYRIASFNEKQERKNILLHREIFRHRGIDLANFYIDHADGNSLNNRFSNLRLCTVSENAINAPIPSNNTSGCKGVDWFESRKKWHSRISVDGKRIFLGYFDDFDAACKARKEAEIQYHGAFRWEG